MGGLLAWRAGSPLQWSHTYCTIHHKGAQIQLVTVTFTITRYTTVQYTTLHYTTVHYTTLQYCPYRVTLSGHAGHVHNERVGGQHKTVRRDLQEDQEEEGGHQEDGGISMSCSSNAYTVLCVLYSALCIVL